MVRIAVVGPGSVGLFFAGHLAAAGHDVVACARRPFDRYRIESPDAPLDHPAVVVTDPSDVSGPVPYVLLAVKAHQTEGAAPWLNALCDADTRVLVVQNGIEHDVATPYVNGATIVPTVVYCGAELIEPGYIEHATAGHLFVPAQPFGDELLAIFEASKAEVRPTDDFVTEQWRKLSVNVTVNGLTALTNRGLGVLGDPALGPIAVEVLRECWQVAKADGANVDPDKAAKLIQLIGANRPEEAGTSMLYDTRAARPTEHEAIQGAALRRAARHGIDTPHIAMMYALLEARNNGLTP